MRTPPATPDDPFRTQILDAARTQVRRFGEHKTNVVDIAQALGTSHTTIYRHFRSKAEIFDALVEEAMRDEEEIARRFVNADSSAADRLEGMVLALHARKRERFAGDPEIYQLYRRVVEERPEIITAYARAMTMLAGKIIADGVEQREFKIDDVAAAAGVLRDAVTVFLHPALVEASTKAGLPTDEFARQVVRTIVAAFQSGIRYADD